MSGGRFSGVLESAHEFLHCLDREAINICGQNRWLTLIQNASLHHQEARLNRFIAAVGLISVAFGGFWTWQAYESVVLCLGGISGIHFTGCWNLDVYLWLIAVPFLAIGLVLVAYS